jgi:hypothetical protein
LTCDLCIGSESKYAIGPSLACSATKQDRGFVSFSSQRTYWGGLVKLGSFDAKQRINPKSDTWSGLTRIHLDFRISGQDYILTFP